MTISGAGETSFFVLDAGVSLLMIALAAFWPSLGSRWFARAERVMRRLAEHRGASVLSVGVAALLLRLLFLPLVPIPQPYIHDEFSYLLAADTFASGRLTNPTHPMWRYLESFHITQIPTYMSMYPPAQGMVLAAGQVLTGVPWIGVWLTAGLMCSAICWMLQGWLPPRWALFGGALALLRLALFSYWGNSYYGGAVAAVGGALVLGALPRLMKSGRTRDGVLMAAGLAILANSRPYEGLLLAVPVAGALLLRGIRTRAKTSGMVLRRAAAPALLLLAVAGAMGYYNHRVYGNTFALPYQVNRAQYASAPVFLWQQPRPIPEYRYRAIRDFYTDQELGDFLRARTPEGFMRATVQKSATAVLFFLGIALLPALFVLPQLIRDLRIRFLLIAGMVYAVGLSLNAWLFPHYLAPFAGGIYAVTLQAMRHLRAWRPGARPVGLAMVRGMASATLLLAGLRVFSGPLGLAIPRWPTMWYGTEPMGLSRAKVASELEKLPGRQLAIVEYGAEHLPFEDWVYNRADIEHAKVVWARESETGCGSDLRNYFGDRKVWIIRPDANPVEVQAAPPARLRTGP